jgi:hypothetical protein
LQKEKKELRFKTIRHRPNMAKLSLNADKNNPADYAEAAQRAPDIYLLLKEQRGNKKYQ